MGRLKIFLMSVLLIVGHTLHAEEKNWMNDLSARTQNVFLNQGIKSPWELANMTEKELLRFPDFGLKSLNELKAYLRERYSGDWFKCRM